MIGSHGPTYYRRYPKKHGVFLPDCPQSDIQNCTSEQIINTYDNTIAYTDRVLSMIITKLLSLPDEVSASLLYVSDHGESLGEKGVYLHGFPYAFAPKEQTHIPMLLWLTRQNNDINSSCIRKRAQNNQYNHDFVFHSILDLLNIQTKAYVDSKDIFFGCKKQ
jgi:lipid A ethanolaminephosphotransferase